MRFYNNNFEVWVNHGLVPDTNVYYVVLNDNGIQAIQIHHPNFSTLINPVFEDIIGKNIIALTYHGNINDYDSQLIEGCKMRMESRFKRV
jgi:hypothetical protein